MLTALKCRCSTSPGTWFWAQKSNRTWCVPLPHRRLRRRRLVAVDHTPDEHIELAEFRRAVEVLAGAVEVMVG